MGARLRGHIAGAVMYVTSHNQDTYSLLQLLPGHKSVTPHTILSRCMMLLQYTRAPLIGRLQLALTAHVKSNPEMPLVEGT